MEDDRKAPLVERAIDGVVYKLDHQRCLLVMSREGGVEQGQSRKVLGFRFQCSFVREQPEGEPLVTWIMHRKHLIADWHRFSRFFMLHK